MDCIIQHWSIHPWYPKAISTFSFPRCSNPFSLIPIRSQKTYFQNLRYPRLGQWRNRGLNYSKLEYPEYPKPIQSVRPDMCHLDHRTARPPLSCPLIHIDHVKLCESWLFLKLLRECGEIKAIVSALRLNLRFNFLISAFISTSCWLEILSSTVGKKSDIFRLSLSILQQYSLYLGRLKILQGVFFLHWASP